MKTDNASIRVYTTLKSLYHVVPDMFTWKSPNYIICHFDMNNHLHNDIIRVLYLCTTITHQHHNWFYKHIVKFLRNHPTNNNMLWDDDYIEFVNQIKDNIKYINLQKTVTHTFRKAFQNGKFHESHTLPNPHVTIHIDDQHIISFIKQLYQHEVIEYASFNLLHILFKYHHNNDFESISSSDTEPEDDVEYILSDDDNDNDEQQQTYYPKPNVILSTDHNGNLITKPLQQHTETAKTLVSFSRQTTIYDIINKYANHYKKFPLPQNVHISKLYDYVLDHNLHRKDHEKYRVLYYFAICFQYQINNANHLLTFPLCYFAGQLHKNQEYDDAYIVAKHCSQDTKYCSAYVHRQLAEYYQYGIGGAPRNIAKCLQHYYKALRYSKHTGKQIKNTSHEEYDRLLRIYKIENNGKSYIMN